MAIEKYACTRNYGFGFPQCSYKYTNHDRTITMGNTAYIYILMENRLDHQSTLEEIKLS